MGSAKIDDAERKKKQDAKTEKIFLFDLLPIEKLIILDAFFNSTNRKNKEIILNQLFNSSKYS